MPNVVKFQPSVTGLTLEERETIEGMAIAACADEPKPTLFGIARAIGVPYMTLYRLMDQHEGAGRRIREAMRIADLAAVDEVAEAHFDLATGKSKAGNVIAQIHILKNRDKRYAERHQAIGSITVNIDRAQIALAGQTIEEMRKIEGSDE